MPFSLPYTRDDTTEMYFQRGVESSASKWTPRASNDLRKRGQLMSMLHLSAHAHGCWSSCGVFQTVRCYRILA